MMPVIAAPAAGEGDAIGTIEIAASAPLFDEHFENFAVLPGSFSLALVIDMLFRTLGIERTRLGEGIILRKINFIRPVRPGERLTASLKRLQCHGARTTAHVELRNDSDANVMDGVVSWEHSA